MARRLSIYAGRPQAAPAETIEPQAPLAVEPPAKKPKKAAAPRKPRVARVPKTLPRMRARWCVYDGAMKPVAVFAYNQRAAADAKLADLAARGKGTHFLQVIKDLMPEVAAPS